MSVPVVIGIAVAGVGLYAVYNRNASGSTVSDATHAQKKPVFGSFGFHSLKVQSTEMVNHNVKRVRFELPDASQPSGLTVSSAVLTFAFPGGSWIPCVRPYTPVNRLDEPGVLDLLVKQYPHGRQSTHIHALRPGDTLTMAPLKTGGYTANQHERVALVAGGTGINPMVQLARGILADPADRTRITLVWGVHGARDLFLADELAALERAHPGRFAAHYVVAEEPEAAAAADASTDPHIQQGRVTAPVLEALGLDARKQENRNTKVFVSGPPAMEKALVGSWSVWPGGKTKGVLAELGYTPAQVHKF